MHIARHCRKPRTAFAVGMLFALVMLALQPATVRAGQVFSSSQGNQPRSPEKVLMTMANFSRPAAQSEVRSVEWTYHKTADGAHPNDMEQQILWLMNRARTNPAGEAAWLSTTGELDVSRAREYFKIDLDRMAREFTSYLPKPPAAFDARLWEAARAHSANLIARDSQDHDGQYDRVVEAGFKCDGGWGYYFRGNVFSFAENGLNTHAAWNIDWGGPQEQGGMQTDRGHRMGVMTVDGDLTNAGIAMLYEGVAETLVGPFVTTADYCHAAENTPNHYNRFLVGTVWQDADRDGMYDPGEGIGGVTVRAASAGFYAVTSKSGGYAVPITREGKYRVMFTGPVNGTREVEIGKTSVLLDYVHDYSIGQVRFHATLSEREP